jgi:hypothetical protein
MTVEEVHRLDAVVDSVEIVYRLRETASSNPALLNGFSRKASPSHKTGRSSIKLSMFPVTYRTLRSGLVARIRWTITSPLKFWHVQIGHQEIDGRPAIKKRDGIQTITCLEYLVALYFQDATGDLANVLFVIDNENGRR